MQDMGSTAAESSYKAAERQNRQIGLNQAEDVSTLQDKRKKMMMIFVVCAMLIGLALLFAPTPGSTVNISIPTTSSAASTPSVTVSPSCADQGKVCPVGFK